MASSEPNETRSAAPPEGFGRYIRGRKTELSFDGRTIHAFEGESVGAALHAAGERVLARSSKYHRPRGLTCMIGKCPSCMCRVDGIPNVRVCTLAARDGMRIETQNALPGARDDLLRVVDRAFPREFAHHTSFTSRFLIPFYHPIARRMAGLGVVPTPTATRAAPPAIARFRCDVAVVGAGLAGLAAAEAAAAAARRVLVVEESARVGGDRALERGGAAETRALAARLARNPRVTLLTRTAAVGLYRPSGTSEPHDADASRPSETLGTLALALPDRLGEVAPRALVLATGAYEVPLLAPGNDLPGVMGARAARILALESGGRPATRAMLVSRGKESELEEVLAAVGCDTVARVDPDAVVALEGARTVEFARLKTGERIAIDGVIVAAERAPRVELVQQADAAIDVDAAALPRPRVGPDGATTNPLVFAAGELAGAPDARASGAAAGRAAARRAA
ncbi:MAG: 2Fe-2S iron-sulfur cluster-binding protein [Thermoplasmatota archaeon]